QARPDDKFPVRVDVDAKNLADHDVTVKLDIFKPKADLKKDQPAYQMEVQGKFSKDPNLPHAQVEFQIDPAQVPAELRKPGDSSAKPELEEGEYKIRARVPKDKEEVFKDKEHVSDAATVNVVKRPIRVLLFASAPTREYQFLRTLFVRETDRQRADLSICLQLARENIVQDVPQAQLLKQFPTTFGDVDGKSDDKYDNLALYDVVVAFDPDWTQLTPEQMSMLENWVNAHYGGLILIGGPVHTYQLARAQNKSKLQPILDLYPVELADNRYEGGHDRPTTDPQLLRFPGASSDMEFLNLNEDKDSPLSGWEEFFTGQKDRRGDEGPPRRGFYSYYPVLQKKANATVVATFADARSRLNNGQEQPYLVTMPYGSGKVVYISSGEMWRLRQYHEAFHERFWTKLARYVGSGNLTRLNRHGDIFMGPTYTANDSVSFDARLYGRDMQPLDKDSRPKFRLKVPQGAPMPALEPMKAKPNDPWNGFFTARFTPTVDGNYEVELDVPDTQETLRHKFYVKASNPELDNTMPDFARLRQLATDATKVLNRIKDEDRSKVRPVLERTNNEAGTNSLGAGAGQNKLKLYFDVEGARAIPDCMISDSRPLKTRGPIKDLWDEGFTVGDYDDRPLTVSWVLLGVAGLLSIEWLTRKLLKLA
ncbi:MAG TPA: hypothetical protein VG013_12840, partial [Gemmataceae bacterium]|nr:hypothetical protein [Gemmataceae bacterium]